MMLKSNKRITLTAVFISMVFLMTGLFYFEVGEAQRQTRTTQFPTVELGCKHLHVISQGFLRQHIVQDAFSPELEKRTVQQYIEKMDPFKIYLLESDIKSIEKDLAGVFNKIKSYDCKALQSAQATYVKRVQERTEFVKNFLGDKNYKFDKSTQIVLDPKERKYPKNTKEALDYHKKYVHFQVSTNMAAGETLEEAKASVVRKYERALKRIRATTQEDLYASYLDSFARALDPHSSYFSKDVLEDFEISMRLQLEGIGATLSSQDGFTVVEQLVPGGAAAKSGLIQPKDKIIAVGQMKGEEEQALENVVEMDLRDVVRKIRGPKGTQVRLKLLRRTGSESETLIVTLTRDKINLEDEAASISYLEKNINGVKRKVGIINLPSFYADSRKGGRSSAGDLKKLIQQAKTQKVHGLVLDLSTNGGGSLDDAVQTAGLFFKTGNVVKQSSRLTEHDGQATILRDTDKTVDWEGPLVVLTSRVSASASEIVAGTLQDYRRAVIVGNDHTFGKGSVQQVVQLPPGLGAIKVTVGMFFTPGGNSTQHRGVNSDIVLPSVLATDEVGEKTLEYSLPPQKVKAFISPDAFVESGPDAWKPVDSSTIALLEQRSKIRVAHDPEFAKVYEEIKKAEKQKKLITLADSIKETKESEEEREQQRTMSKKEKLAEYHKRADIQEAANILVDLVDLQGKVKLSIADEGKKGPSGVPAKENL